MKPNFIEKYDAALRLVCPYEDCQKAYLHDFRVDVTKTFRDLTLSGARSSDKALVTVDAASGLTYRAAIRPPAPEWSESDRVRIFFFCEFCGRESLFDVIQDSEGSRFEIGLCDKKRNGYGEEEDDDEEESGTSSVPE